MKILKTKKFNKWAKKQKISDEQLHHSAIEIKNGHYEASYGSGIIKKRVANKNRGKSGSTRTIVVFKQGHHCFYLLGFDKGERSNISESEEKALKVFAKELLKFTDKEINHLINSKKLIEVYHEKE